MLPEQLKRIGVVFASLLLLILLAAGCLYLIPALQPILVMKTVFTALNLSDLFAIAVFGTAVAVLAATHSFERRQNAQFPQQQRPQALYTPQAQRLNYLLDRAREQRQLRAWRDWEPFLNQATIPIESPQIPIPAPPPLPPAARTFAERLREIEFNIDDIDDNDPEYSNFFDPIYYTLIEDPVDLVTEITTPDTDKMQRISFICDRHTFYGLLYSQTTEAIKFRVLHNLPPLTENEVLKQPFNQQPVIQMVSRKDILEKIEKFVKEKEEKYQDNQAKAEPKEREKRTLKG